MTNSTNIKPEDLKVQRNKGANGMHLVEVAGHRYELKRCGKHGVFGCRFWLVFCDGNSDRSYIDMPCETIKEALRWIVKDLQRAEQFELEANI